MINDQYAMIIRKAAVEIGGSFTNLAFQVVDGSVSARSQLAQSRPTDTTATSILAPSSGTTYGISTLIICNTTGSDATYRIFHDNDGTTYDETTALFYDQTIRNNTTVGLDLALILKDGGNLAVRSGTGSALTFTVYGITFIS